MAISMKSIPLFLTVAALSANIVDFPKQEYAAPLKQEIVKEKQKDPSFAYFSYSPMVYAVLPLATVGSALSFGWYDSGKTGAAVTGISAGLTTLAYMAPHGIGYRKFVGPFAFDFAAHFYSLSASAGLYFYMNPTGRASAYFGAQYAAYIPLFLKYESERFKTDIYTGNISKIPRLVLGVQDNNNGNKFYQFSLQLGKRKNELFGKGYDSIVDAALTFEYGKSF